MLIINPKEKDLGDGFKVRRLLPTSQKRLVGPFIFWDHMGPVDLTKGDFKLKVRAHPHIGLATLTYLFNGEITHRDSLKNKTLIRPGEVNWMVAGEGIVHSERSPEKPDPKFKELEGIQLWIALPKEQSDVSPSFTHHKESELPKINLNGSELSLIAGKWGEVESPVPVHSELFYMTKKLKAGETLKFNLKKSHELGIYGPHGDLLLNNEIIKTSHLSIINEEETREIEILSRSETQIMLFGGVPFDRDPFIEWNLVSFDKDKIESAKEKWRAQKYPPVIDESEWIPY